MIDWTKPLQTVNGEEAELLGVLNGNRFGYVIRVFETGGTHRCCFVDSEGIAAPVLRYIINVPVITEKNIYLGLRDDGNIAWTTTPILRPHGCIASIRVDAKFVHGVFAE